MMFEDRICWYQVFLLLLIPMRVISSQGLGCYKCLTDYRQGQIDSCQDPFSSEKNPIHSNCQATSFRKNGTFPARFCVKITGRIVSVDGTTNRSYLNTILYYRTCVFDNIMESTKLLKTSGNFLLKGLPEIDGLIRLQGSISICTIDGCNHARTLFQTQSTFIFIIAILVFLFFFQKIY